MIIQCRQCATKFRFSDELMTGDGVWVRCGRCGHEFFEINPLKDAGPPPARRKEAPAAAGVRIAAAGAGSGAAAAFGTAASAGGSAWPSRGAGGSSPAVRVGPIGGTKESLFVLISKNS